MAELHNCKKTDNHSILSENSSHSLKSVWQRLSHLFNNHNAKEDLMSPNSNKRRYSTLSSETGASSQHNKCASMTDSTTTCSSLLSSSTTSSNNSSNISNDSRRRHRKVLTDNSHGRYHHYHHSKGLQHKQQQDQLSAASQMIIPPFSPTYCKPNEFPYSNFYVKLPNGKWMVRYRSGNRDILGTDEFEGYLI